MGINSIKTFRGDSLTINLTFTNSSGTAIDISNYTIFFTVKENFTDSDDNAKIKKDVTSHSDPTKGKTIVSIDSADTLSITPETYKYDVQVKDGSGDIFTVVQDDFIIEYDVTVRTS